MPKQSRKIVASIVLVVETIALVLLIYGGSIRFFGTGNAVGNRSILIGSCLAVAASLPMLFFWFVDRRQQSSR